MSYGEGRRHGSDPELLWLWCRPLATAPVGPLAWEPPYAMGVALEKDKTNLKKPLHLYILTVKDQKEKFTIYHHIKKE